MLKFKVDENLPVEVAALLIEAGHDALTVPQQNMGGQADPRLATVCQVENRAILTLDLDFADIRAYAPQNYAGIIVLRLSRLDKHRVLTSVKRLIAVFDREPLAGRLWIVDESSVRIRD
jgi:predicted nuclease of predicted toxin-antitoxin system